MRSSAVRIEKFGNPEVMQLVAVDLPPPGPGEARIRHTAIGLNYVDTQQRTGLGYPLPLPTGLGHEAVGVVDAIGEGLTDLKPGDRVAYMNAGVGAYATHRNVVADKLVPVPDDVQDDEAAALLFKGLTVQYLIRHTRRISAGDRIVLHAAAGGVGLLLARWATALGADVFGTAGSPEKCRAALAAGCVEVVDYSKDGWADRMIGLLGDAKADIVYDSVGKHTFMHSLDFARSFGTVVVFGAASGPAPAIEPELLNKKGCLFLTRPSVFPHNADPVRLRENASDLFSAIAAGHVRADIGLRLPLAEIVQAHRAIEGRETTGAIVLIP